MTERPEGSTTGHTPEPTIDVSEHGRHASAAVPGESGHHTPGDRAHVVDDVLDDERVQHAERVTISVPRGDSEALDEARARLGTHEVRPAGSTVIVEGRPLHDRPDADQDQ